MRAPRFRPPATRVIVVTGPGRAGTTFLAALYRDLGFDPGGQWNASVNAGLEAKRFQRINTEVASALGMVASPRAGPRFLKRVDRQSAKRLPASAHRHVNSALNVLRYRHNSLDLMDWSRLETVVAEYGDTMRAWSEETPVVKDPRFCWTLHAWLASGAPITSVVLALRPLESMVDSRVRAGMIPDRARLWATNNFAYGIGLALSAASEYRVPVEILRFPDFLDQPLDLFERLPLPEDRSWEDFRSAFDRVHDESLVHDRR